MRIVVALIFGMSLFQSFEIVAQKSEVHEAKVVFHPLFWKEKLKLSDGQYKEILNINKDYYEELFKAANENAGDIYYLRSVTEDLLQRRSDRIWGTFHNKQKKVWMKLSASYGLDSNPSSAYSRAIIPLPGAETL